MKKVLMALAVATFFIACSDNSDSTKSTSKDSTTVKTDSTKAVDTATKTAIDTSKMSKDSAHKK